MNLLLVTPASVEKTFLSTPLIRSIKEGGHLLHVASSPEGFPVLRYNPHIDHLFLFESGIAPALESVKWDGIIDLLNSKESKGVWKKHEFQVYKSKIGLGSFFKSYFQKDTDEDFIKSSFSAVKSFSIPLSLRGPEYYFDPKGKLGERDIPVSHQLGYLAITLSSYGKRGLSTAQISRICASVDFPVMLLGNKSDFNEAEAIRKKVDEQRVYNACGKFNFDETVQLIFHSKLLLTDHKLLENLAIMVSRQVIKISPSMHSGAQLEELERKIHARLFATKP